MSGSGTWTVRAILPRPERCFAVIGVLLIYLHTQRPVSKYAYVMLSLVASGQATMEDIGSANISVAMVK